MSEATAWVLIWAIWFSGVGLLYVIWTHRIFATKFLEDTFRIVLFFVASFYFVLIPPIHRWVSRQLNAFLGSGPL